MILVNTSATEVLLHSDADTDARIAERELEYAEYLRELEYVEYLRELEYAEYLRELKYAEYLQDKK
jgi:hypothetical protein